MYKLALFHISVSSWGWASRQNSLSVRESLSVNTKWLETVNLLCNLSTAYLMEDMERTSFQNFIFNLHLIFWKVCPAILCRPQGEKFLFWSFSGWKGELKQCNICIISSNSKFLYYSIHQMWENNTKCFSMILKYR